MALLTFKPSNIYERQRYLDAKEIMTQAEQNRYYEAIRRGYPSEILTGSFDLNHNPSSDFLKENSALCQLKAEIDEWCGNVLED